jgi:cyclophilin family peptidyl-prolyl cis-trans isomerase
MLSNARLLRAAGFFALAVVLTGLALAAGNPENTLVMTLKCGEVVIDLRPDLAPKHVAQIKKLTRQGFYDGIIFHRVIDGFMAQTGDPTGTGTGGSKLPDLAAEFSKEHFSRGTLGMARTSDPNSANSQFFIMFADGGFLDGNYTVFGKVRSGMECVDQINKGEPPANPDKIVRLKVQKDIK